jgi:S-adenosylmethionine/arginine decarboxylase-like enzyme
VLRSGAVPAGFCPGCANGDVASAVLSAASGVTVLAESHISIHTWPEVGYAAIDVFMCGDARPMDCLELLQDRFNPDTVSAESFRRGRLLPQVRAHRVA